MLLSLLLHIDASKGNRPLCLLAQPTREGLSLLKSQEGRLDAVAGKMSYAIGEGRTLELKRNPEGARAEQAPAGKAQGVLPLKTQTEPDITVEVAIPGTALQQDSAGQSRRSSRT